jgi:hypothetical protein
MWLVSTRFISSPFHDSSNAKKQHTKLPFFQTKSQPFALISTDTISMLGDNFDERVHLYFPIGF